VTSSSFAPLPPGPDRDAAVARLKLALDALEQAYQRLQQYRLDIRRAYAPPGETLFWALSCDEGFEELIGAGTYETMKASDPDGQILGGIKWARNRVGHQRALILRRQYGTVPGKWILGLGVLGTVDDMLWADTSTIPPGRSAIGRSTYANRMSGHPVIEAIASARRWLTEAQVQCGF